MNALASEYSSGCDSGWTVYLEQSVLSPNDHHTNFIGSKNCFYSSGKKIVDDDDDQSMVSDASSGPSPLTYDFNNGNGYFSSTLEDMQKNKHQGGKRKKTKEERRSGRLGGKDEELALYLDDTASSPTNFSKKSLAVINKHKASMSGVLEYSQGFSFTRFKGRSK